MHSWYLIYHIVDLFYVLFPFYYVALFNMTVSDRAPLFNLSFTRLAYTNSFYLLTTILFLNPMRYVAFPYYSSDTFLFITAFSFLQCNLNIAYLCQEDYSFLTSGPIKEKFLSLLLFMVVISHLHPV